MSTWCKAGSAWYTAAVALVAALWLPTVSGGPGVLEVHMIDVGQGDAFALRTPRGRWVLIDAGPSWDGGDAGRRAVVPYVQRRGGAVVLMVLSHAHEDHAGGAASVIRALEPRQWWEPAFVTSIDPATATVTLGDGDGALTCARLCYSTRMEERMVTALLVAKVLVADGIMVSVYVGMNNEFFFAIPKRKVMVYYEVPGVSDTGPNPPGKIL